MTSQNTLGSQPARKIDLLTVHMPAHPGLTGGLPRVVWGYPAGAFGPRLSFCCAIQAIRVLTQGGCAPYDFAGPVVEAEGADQTARRDNAPMRRERDRSTDDQRGSDDRRGNACRHELPAPRFGFPRKTTMSAQLCRNYGRPRCPALPVVRTVALPKRATERLAISIGLTGHPFRQSSQKAKSFQDLATLAHHLQLTTLGSAIAEAPSLSACRQSSAANQFNESSWRQGVG